MMKTMAKMAAALAAVMGLIGTARGDLIRVPADYPTIQAAINAAQDGDIVVVWPGVYWENISFNGKAIVVRSTDPQDPGVVSSTIIDGRQAGSVVTFQNGEGLDSVLSGFTLRNGRYDGGGGIYCNAASPLIKHNVVTDNLGTDCAGGIFCAGSSAVLIDNKIINNTAGYDGGGMLCHTYSFITLTDNLIAGNRAIEGMGGGIYYSLSAGKWSNNIIAGNSATAGGGIYAGWIYVGTNPAPTLINNTVVNNSAEAGGGGGIYCENTSPEIANCVLWGNRAGFDPEIYLFGESDPEVTYCDVAGGWPGEGNIDADPLLTPGPLGDYYLEQPGSPCVDAADPACPVARSRTTSPDHRIDRYPLDMGYHYPSLLLPTGKTINEQGGAR